MGNSFFKNKKADDQKINKVVLDEAVSNEITRFSGDLMQDSHYLKQLYSYPTNIDFMLVKRIYHQRNGEKSGIVLYTIHDRCQDH